MKGSFQTPWNYSVIYSRVTNHSAFTAQLVLPFKESTKWRDLLKLQSDARWVKHLPGFFLSIEMIAGFKGVTSSYLRFFWYAKRCLRVNWIPKKMPQLCHLRLYLGIETVSCRPLLRLARMGQTEPILSSVRAREPASFWREVVVAIVLQV